MASNYTWVGKDRNLVTKYTNAYTKDPNFFHKWFETNANSIKYNQLPRDVEGVKAEYGANKGKMYLLTRESKDFIELKWSPALNEAPIYLDDDSSQTPYNAYLNSYGQLAFYPKAFADKIQQTSTSGSQNAVPQTDPTSVGSGNPQQRELLDMHVPTDPKLLNIESPAPLDKDGAKAVVENAIRKLHMQQDANAAARETNGTRDATSSGTGVPEEGTDTETGGTTDSDTETGGTASSVTTYTPLLRRYTMWRDIYGDPSKNPASATDKELESSKKAFDFDWNHLYDLAKSANAIGLAYKNWRIADAAERPILHDPVEHHHAVYGDYFAKTQGLLNAGNLFNAASRPITSDMALTHASLLQSLIAANDAINQGNLVDNQKRELTAEVAWQLEKENKNIRHDVAMANRDAIYKADFNRADLKQLRNAYIHKEIENILGAWLKDYLDFRNERKKYLDLYDQEFAITNGMNNYMANSNIDPNLKLRAHLYLYQPATFNKWYSDASDDEKEQILNIIKGGTTQGHLDYYKNKGVQILQAAQGGHLQKAVLQKRQKDADRFAKLMEESNKRVQKAIFKSIDRMYRTKYLHGGGLVAFNSTPVRTPSETLSPPYWHPLNTASASADKKKDSAGNKLSDLLKTAEALDNDRKVIDANIQKLMNLKDSGVDTSSLEAQALQIQSMILKAKLSYEFKNKVADKLQANGADKEAYIDVNGLVMVYDEGKGYSKVSAEEALLHLHIVTNAEALNYRNTNPNATFNSDLLQDLYASIGMSNIHTSIKNATESLGSTETFLRALGKIENGKLIAGSGSLLESLLKEMKANGVASTLATLDDGIFNVHNSYKTNTAQITSALRAILSSLSTLELAFITLKATREGVSPEAYVLGLLKPKEEIKDNSDIDIDFLGQLGEAAKEKEKKLEDDVPPTAMARTIVGNVGEKKVSVIKMDGFTRENPLGLTALRLISTSGTTTHNENEIWNPEHKTAMTLQGSDIANFTNFNYQSFNGISVYDPSEIILSTNLYEVALLPSTTDENGLLVPDFKKWGRIDKAMDVINEDGGVSKINPDGTVKKEKFTYEDLNLITEILSDPTLSPKQLNDKLLKIYSEEGLGEIKAAFNNDLYMNLSKFMMYSALASNLAFNGEIPLFGKLKDDDETLENFIYLRAANLNLSKAAKDREKKIETTYSGKLYLPYQSDPFHSSKSYSTEASDRRVEKAQGEERRSKVHLQPSIK